MPPPEPPAPPGSGAGLLSDDNIGRLVFFLAMILLGAVLGAIYLTHQSQSTTNSAGGHHALDSPYAALPFFRCATQAQSELGAGHSTARDLSFAYRGRGYQWFSLTDVNTPTPAEQYQPAGLLAVAGQQVQYSFGSFLAYGVDRFLVVDTAKKAIDWIHADAGAAFLAAPLVPPAPAPGSSASPARSSPCAGWPRSSPQAPRR